jgi:hypothetical protein
MFRASFLQRTSYPTSSESSVKTCRKPKRSFVFGEALVEEFSDEGTQEENLFLWLEEIKWFFEHLPNRKLRVALASLLTRDSLTLRKASAITGVSIYALSRQKKIAKEQLIKSLKYQVRFNKQ